MSKKIENSAFEDLIKEVNSISARNKESRNNSRVNFEKYDGVCKEAAVAINSLLDTVSEEKEINERMLLMFNATPLIIEYWDRDFNCIDFNQAAVQHFGFFTKSEYEKKWAELMPPFQPDGTPSLEFWQKQLSKTFDEFYTRWEFVCKKLNGDTVFLEVQAWHIIYDRGSVVITYSNDISELKKTLERVHEVEERNRIMLDGTPVACYLINKDFRAFDCNRETLKLFGFDTVEDGINEFRGIFSKHQFDVMKQLFNQAMETGYERFEWEFENSYGAFIPCEISFIKFSYMGEDVIAAYILDLSALKEILEEKQRVATAEEHNQSKSVFLARMSHEIRTPISAVLGIAEIQLQNPTLPLDTEEAFAKIYSSGSTLLGIVNDILDLSKIEAGKMTLVDDKYEIASLISDVAQLNLVYLGSKKIDFTVEVDENIPAYLIGDELRMKQVLNNLLSNAFKYTEDGAVALIIYSVPSDTEGYVNLLVTIRDTGRGMSSEQVEALFSEYSRFHEKEARYVKGTGLGMSIADSLLRLMGARMNIESEVGKGTEITLLIPQITAGSEVLGAETAKSIGSFSKAARSKKLSFVPDPMPYGKVLVVDDVDTNLYVARGLLKLYKLQIDTCDSGYGAIERVRNGAEYDIIFMDQMMPELTGMETVQILRQMGYINPIVALTANALVGQAEEFLRNGFNGFLSKPIQTVHLNGVLNKFIRDKQPPEVLEAAKVENVEAQTAESKAGTQESLVDYLLDPELLAKVKEDFAKGQHDVLEKVAEAIADGDLQTAQRLVHTLKGLAGLLSAHALVAIAEVVEKTFKRGEMPEESQMIKLEEELEKVMRGLG